MVDEAGPGRGCRAETTAERHPAPERATAEAVAGWEPTDRCGHEWDPEWLSDQAKNQHCCLRRSWPTAESGQCWWHMAGPKSLTDFLTAAEREQYRSDETLAVGDLLDDDRVGRERIANRRHNASVPAGTDGHDPSTADGVAVSEHPAELLCGADLAAVRLEDAMAFTNCWMNGADLSRATLRGADMEGIDLERVTARDAVFRGATLRGADLRGAFDGAHMSGVDLTGADVSEVGYEYAALPRPSLRAATLRGATLSDADCSRADLTDADLSGASFDAANLERATLSRANLFDADLSNARLYGAVLSEAQINEGTTLLTAVDGRLPGLLGGNRRVCAYDPGNPDATPAVAPGRGPSAATGSDGDAAGGAGDHWTKAAGTYRKLERLADENSFPARQRTMFLRRKNAQRRKKRATSGFASPGHVGAALAGLVFRHGEGYARVLGWCVAVVAAFAVAFPLTGSIQPVGDGARLESAITPERVLEDPALLWDSLYYSTLTFTNLGFGDFRPAGTVGQALTVLETAVGVVLLSLLVFVLGRRAAR